MINPIKLLIILAATLSSHSTVALAQQEPVYTTYGTHNPPDPTKCADPECVYHRGPGEPSDPEFPAYWSSRWTMYRVFNKFAEFPPPYAGRPPEAMKEGTDYEVSYGATYYDSTWRGPTGDGAMMEHYEKRCLPIFPFSNHYSRSFISLDDVAFFVTYEQDRPTGMPPVCLFSPLNHPPRRNFISHLPYALGDSQRLGMAVQGYSFWILPASDKPAQVGVSPDQTVNGGIMFGYAFEALPRPDAADPKAAPYRHPQSFYFSGVYDPQVPETPPAAPIVTQNYTDFAMVRPDPARTWDTVKNLDWQKLPPCHLFPPGAPAKSAVEGASHAGGTRSWSDLGRAH
jgi:hypothetical protein